MLTEIVPGKAGEMRTQAHEKIAEPSEWVVRWLAGRPVGRLLDLACGSGRHARWAASLGHQVLAVDRDETALLGIRTAGDERITVRCEDLETAPWCLAGACFDSVVCTNYLFRPRLPLMVDLLAPEGIWIHETFAQGNADYGRPRNPDFLLREGELLQWAQGAGLQVIGFESGVVGRPGRAVVQRIAAVRSRKPQPV